METGFNILSSETLTGRTIFEGRTPDKDIAFDVVRWLHDFGRRQKLYIRKVDKKDKNILGAWIYIDQRDGGLIKYRTVISTSSN